MKLQTSNVARVSLKRKDCGWIRGFDVVKFDRMMAGGRKVPLVG